MQRKKTFMGTASALGMLVLILDGKTAIQGAQEGMTLCLETVIPALFPFFLLSSVLNSTWYGIRIPTLGKLFRMAEGTETLLIPAFLGGYPVGAQNIGQLYSSGQLSRQEAMRLLTFCSNAGPAFLFGMVGSAFSSPGSPWLCWGIQITSALLTVWLGSAAQPMVAPSETEHASPSAILPAIRAMAQVCGWVVAFRVLLAVLNRWLLWRLPGWTCVLITGLLELTNGCCSLTAIAFEPLRFIMCNLFLSFGGICVLMQTASVIGNLPLSCYLKGKLIQTAFALLLSLAVTQKAWWSIPIVVGAIFYRPFRKKSGNLSPGVV